MSSPRIEIIKELRALEQFCTFKAVRTGEESERFLRDYLADIEEFPLEAIKAACADWRRSSSTKFPTPGQLIPMIRAKIASKTEPAARSWEPLSDMAYQALSLDAKIRHHLILANQADVKAGPMWRDGKPRNAEDMPASWRENRDRATNHREEARRLRQILSRVERQA